MSEGFAQGGKLDFDRGPAREYEVTWSNGHVETIKAHQVMLPQVSLFGTRPGRQRYTFHAEIDGHWVLVLDAPADDIHIVREKSSEQIPGGAR